MAYYLGIDVGTSGTKVLVMDDRPGSIASRVPVELPRPRQLAMQSSAAFHETSAAVRAAIEGRLKNSDGEALIAW